MKETAKIRARDPAIERCAGDIGEAHRLLQEIAELLETHERIYESFHNDVALTAPGVTVECLRSLADYLRRITLRPGKGDVVEAC